MDPYRKKFFVPFLVPVVPLAIALAALGGVGVFTVGVVGLAVWLAWRQSWRAMRRCGGGPAEPVGHRVGMFEPPPPPAAPPPAAAGPSSPPSPRPPRSEPVPSKELLPAALARAAARRGGSITVSEGVVETGAEMLDVSEVLDRLDRDGYVTAVHRPGVDELVYRFQEIETRSGGEAPA